jgi:hypothetical protein
MVMVKNSNLLLAANVANGPYVEKGLGKET